MGVLSSPLFVPPARISPSLPPSLLEHSTSLLSGLFIVPILYSSYPLPLVLEGHKRWRKREILAKGKLQVRGRGYGKEGNRKRYVFRNTLSSGSQVHSPVISQDHRKVQARSYGILFAFMVQRSRKTQTRLTLRLFHKGLRNEKKKGSDITRK